ncbi:tetratricopeptide repeat-containing sulfotransferase family protein [uncultured Tateyamaria sp.]|uniref:tetratricopeptide repeat-containing sulfotransferase family protein n=1 Tax=uncultured Tateyamaria sp. TaxID=455651 RepID=UPI00260AB9B1|nr:tetratricopeptide repeat-containing sulfotransferase family protein [uncultured Tateyamaria sp.]
MTSSTLSSDPDTLSQVNQELERIQRHQKAGRYDAAGQAIGTLLATYPDHPQLVHLKGLNLIYTGQTDQGLALLELVVSDDPDNVLALVDLGSFLARAGKLDDAIPKFQLAVEIAPNHALAQANLGAALLVKERYGPAIEALNKAIDLNSDLLDAHLNLAQAYIRSNRHAQAVNPLFRALALDPQSVAAHENLALALFRAERHEAGEHHARRALELDPNAVGAKFHLGNILAAMGRIEAAAEVLLPIAANPRIGLGALNRLITLRKTTADSPEYKLLQKYMEQLDNMPDPARQTLHFAMGAAADSMNDPATAIDHFRKGNAISAQLHPFQQDNHDTRHDRIRDLVTPAFVARHRDAGLHDLAPIFICGMPRSGTTLMDQMFSRHSAVQAGGELRATSYAFGQSPDLRKVLEREAPDDTVTDDMLTTLAEHYQTYLHNEGLKSEYVSDKMPGNYLYAGMLALAFPRAKVLIMRRHPMDCLLSNFMQNFGSNQPFSTRIDTLVDVYKQFDQSARHSLAVLPEQVRFVEYEAVVADPEGQMRDVMDFVGLPFEEAMLDHAASLRPVNTASVSQVRAPIYATSVAKWQRYGPLLQDMADRLGDHLSAEDRRLCGLQG